MNFVHKKLIRTCIPISIYSRNSILVFHFRYLNLNNLNFVFYPVTISVKTKNSGCLNPCLIQRNTGKSSEKPARKYKLEAKTFALQRRPFWKPFENMNGYANTRTLSNVTIIDQIYIDNVIKCRKITDVIHKCIQFLTGWRKKLKETFCPSLCRVFIGRQS